MFEFPGAKLGRELGDDVRVPHRGIGVRAILRDTHTMQCPRGKPGPGLPVLDVLPARGVGRELVASADWKFKAPFWVR